MRRHPNNVIGEVFFFANRKQSVFFLKLMCKISRQKKYTLDTQQSRPDIQTGRVIQSVKIKTV